jgi:hypothetical protein
MKITMGSRMMAASLSVCLMLLAAAAPGFAFQQPIGEDPGGGITCVNCGANTVTKTGTATDGSASNGSNQSDFTLTYGVPNDGRQYSGQLMTQVVNADGSVTVNTWPISDFGDGNSAGFAWAYNDSRIPIGGSASISIFETAPNGATFSAGWRVQNFRP